MHAVARCGAEAVQVRLPSDLEGLSGLIIPGGESTTIGKLMERCGLDEAIKKFAARGGAVFGTCAGMILMAKEIAAGRGDACVAPTPLGLMDISVQRNAYGRQVESFEADLEKSKLGSQPLRGVFIRAPVLSRVGKGVEVLAEFEGRPVLVEQGKMLAAAFHPELTDDSRVHQRFLSLCQSK
jgi:5'-phosphate synthase pdxT subunit